ncbi:hypothetical protein GOP47_0004277 [Adiantum capillus-veneris]|uniref:Uncharacterized protein n=1 Tax=Adiantum capillus-veneris TaxID=13818 RepID=A0A9D4V7S7_ADICA|nr:hypothetical protein GOP47_0004277 [Adiantum capillus-veneris]
MTVSAAIVDVTSMQEATPTPSGAPIVGDVCPRTSKKSYVREPPQRFRLKEDMENQNQRTNVPAARK